MKKTRTKYDTILMIFFLIYLLTMTWIILFKLATPSTLYRLGGVRSLNLIPFNGLELHNFISNFRRTDISGNIYIFIPFGIFISTFFGKYSVIKSCIAGITLSLFYETAQYIFAFGRSDITDIITNTLGAVIGVIIYQVLCLLLRDKKKTHKVIAICSMVFGIMGILFITLLIIMNLNN